MEHRGITFALYVSTAQGALKGRGSGGSRPAPRTGQLRAQASRHVGGFLAQKLKLAACHLTLQASDGRWESYPPVTEGLGDGVQMTTSSSAEHGNRPP